MTSLARLEAYTGELTSAANCLINYGQNVEASVDFARNSLLQPFVARDAPAEVHRARRSILANTNKIQVLLGEPTDLLRELARQNQILACLRWLGEFQVLAYIPLGGSVAIKDLAELAGVPETQLCSIVRMTATAGFLREPQADEIAHSALSAPFVAKPSSLDALMFLAETAAPAALQMAAATQRYGHSPQPNQCAYNVAFDTTASFASACEQQPRLQRQWPAYLHYGTGDDDSKLSDVILSDILTRLDWLSLGNCCVVEGGARSTATAVTIANLYPSLRFVVQLSGLEPSGQVPRESMINQSPLPNLLPPSRASTSGRKPAEMQQQLSSRITVQQRTPGTPQSVHDAAVYILHLPSPSPTITHQSLSGHILAELKAHVSILRANSRATLILTTRVLPEPGTVDPDIEAMARVRDLSLLQLANKREIEISELMDVLNSVKDSMGHLVLGNRIRSRNNAVVAFKILYHAYADHREAPPDCFN